MYLAKGKIALLVMLVAFGLSACDKLTEHEEDVRVKLNSFQLIGTPEGSVQSRAALIGNPACTPSPITLNSLLVEADNYDKIDDYLETLDINAVRYRVNNNTTPSDVNASVSLTHPQSGELVTVASVPVTAGTIISEWTIMPFTDEGKQIMQHYMDNLNDEFMYCGESTPDTSQTSLGFDLQIDLTVTLDFL